MTEFPIGRSSVMAAHTKIPDTTSNLLPNGETTKFHSSFDHFALVESNLVAQNSKTEIVEKEKITWQESVTSQLGALNQQITTLRNTVASLEREIGNLKTTVASQTIQISSN